MKTAHKATRRDIILGTLLTTLLIFFSGIATAQLNITSADTIDLWVYVAQKTMVDIQPDDLGWYGVDPGTETNASQLVGWTAKKPAIQIENIGSTNISRIWFNSTYPASNPFGGGSANDYDAGNFVVVKNNQSAANPYFFPNLVEYNESEIIYLQLPVVGGSWAHGRFHAANKEYFWAVNTTSGNCSRSQFRIGKTAHNASQQGTVDLRTCDATLTTEGANDCRQGTLTRTLLFPYTGNNQWGWADLYIGPNGAASRLNYTVAVHWNCSDTVKVMFYHWNQDAPGAQEGANHPEYFMSGATLKPGQHIIGNVKLLIPYGTAYGNITGSLTAIVQALNVLG
jgi:hypothetical protein